MVCPPSSRHRWPSLGAAAAAACALALLLTPGASGDAVGPRAVVAVHAAAGAQAAGRAAAVPPQPTRTRETQRSPAAPVTAARAPDAAPVQPFAPGGDEFLSGFEAPRPVEHVTSSPDRLAARAGRAPPGRSGGVAAPAPLAPLLSLRLDRARLRAGETAWLNLSTSGAVACTGVQGVAGGLPLQGRVPVDGLPPGRHVLRVACRGAGAAVEQAVVAVVPLPVDPDSRDNHCRAERDGAWRERAAWLQMAEAILPAALAGADFLQEGRVALFAARGGGDGPAQAHFESIDDQGRWQDRSAELLPDAQDRALCRGATQALVTDLNGDGRPDLYLACSEGPQWLLLSNPDGRYRRTATPFVLAALQAEAWDADGDGLVDIVTTVAAPGAPHTLLLAGRGDGRLEPVVAAVPAAQGRR